MMWKKSSKQRSKAVIVDRMADVMALKTAKRKVMPVM